MFDLLWLGSPSAKNDDLAGWSVFATDFFVTRPRLCADAGSQHETAAREPWRGAVPVLDAENPPARLSATPPFKVKFHGLQHSRCLAAEVWAAVERSRKYINQYMGGLLTAENVEDAEAIIIASQVGLRPDLASRSHLRGKGDKIGLIKVDPCGPFPDSELLRKLWKSQS